MFAVELERWTGPGDADEDLPFTRPDYEAMRRETGVFTDAFAMFDTGVTRFEGVGPRQRELLPGAGGAGGARTAVAPTSSWRVAGYNL